MEASGETGTYFLLLLLIQYSFVLFIKTWFVIDVMLPLGRSRGRNAHV